MLCQDVMGNREVLEEEGHVLRAVGGRSTSGDVLLISPTLAATCS